NFRSEAEAEAIVNAGPLLTTPDRVSEIGRAACREMADSAAVTLPWPVKLAPLPTVTPDASLSVPPLSTIWPLVMLSAAPIVSAPPAPTSSVWLALLIVIAAAEVAVFENFRSEAEAEAIVNAGPLLTTPDRVS